MKNTLTKITLLLIIFSLYSCTKFGPEHEKAWELIEKGALLIDVRSKEEFKDGRLANAINIEYENIAKISQAIGQEKNRSVVLYCRSGRRASVALTELSKLGYDNITNAGGLSAMQAALESKLKADTINTKE